MLDILIDTNNTHSTFVLLKDKKNVAMQQLEIKQDLTQHFVESFKWFIYKHKVNLDEVNNLYFINGISSSFTNVRLSTLFVKELALLHPNMQIKWQDTLHFYADYTKNQFLYSVLSNNQYVVFIHRGCETVLNTKLINQTEFKFLRDYFLNLRFESLDFSKVHLAKEQDINYTNLYLFHDVHDVLDLHANYMKEPNISC